MGGGDIGAAFDAALARTGRSLTSKDLVDMYPPLPPVPAESSLVDLPQCKFFDLFDADPAQARAEMEKERQKSRKLHGDDYVQSALRSSRHHPLKGKRQFDFRLTPAEKTKLAATGLVAVERMRAQSFGEIYYRLYTDDLPVFVTADSILHAWHRSFDAFLIELETQQLSSTLDKLLDASLAKCQAMAADASTVGSSVSHAVRDVAEYLTMGLSLLQGGLEQKSSKLATLWSAVQAEKTMEAEVFSAQRSLDFSLFKPRGHYTKSRHLERYFRAMMWLGTVDFRFAGGESQQDDLHQLLCAVVLVQCLQDSDSLESVGSVDSLISCLVADGDIGADSLSANELAALVLPTGLAASLLADGTTDTERQKQLLGLQQQIVQKSLGKQLVTGHPIVEDESSGPTIPPTAFALLGQRFVWSAFIFTRLVYDQVAQSGKKQPRRVPSAVDVAFALFGNNEAAQELADRMEAKLNGGNTTDDFVQHRDGIPFASNLVALRQVIDAEFDDDEDSKQRSGATESASISTLWLRALRALSRPSPNEASTFHSSTWQRRQMSTQIASFTQLRHDAVLYAKQSYTRKTCCEYPDGMVDPYPVFWQRMRDLAERMEGIADKAQELLPNGWGSYGIQRGCLAFEAFASIMKKLEEIALSQASKKKLSEEQVEFMKSVMEASRGSGASQYRGWYPQLFFESPQDSGRRDVLVVDVHTDSPSPEHRDPGGVLHLGVGDPLVAFFVVNKVVYAGPVFSSYEFLTSIDTRLTDKEFDAQLPSMSVPKWAHDSFWCCEQPTENSNAKEESSRSLPKWKHMPALR